VAAVIGLAEGSLFSWPVLPSHRTAVADSQPKIDEASIETERE